MKDTKLVQLLNTFSPEEWKEFEKFAASPYFNKGRNYIPVIKFFKDRINGNELINPEPEAIYKKLYPGKQFNKSVINTMLSGLTKLAEAFLIQKNYDSNGRDKQIALLKQLNLRNCDKLFEKEAALAMRDAMKTPFDLDTIDFMRNIQENIIRAKYKTNFDKSIENEVHKRFDLRFFVFYLWLLNEERDLKVMKNVFNKVSSERISTQVNESINSKMVLDYMEEYYPEMLNTAGLRILVHTSKDYYKIKERFFSSYNLFTQNFALNTAYVIEGMIVELINEGNHSLLKERHLLHRFMLEKDLLINSNSKTMNTRVTENFIYIALWCKEYNWLEDFIRDYKNTFAPEMRENLINFGDACILYSRGKLRDALKMINLVGDTLITMKLRMKDLELQILYELDEIEPMFFAIDNYIKFKNNPLISEWNRTIMDSNINAYKSLAGIKTGKKSDDPGLIIKKLQSSLPSQFGDWLIKKFSEINK